MKGTITLIGMMGAGKSAVGAELARQLAVPFHDSDTEIERAAAMRVSEIFARDGEAFFRAREVEIIARLLAAGPMVLAVGGGAWMRADTRAAIAAAGLSVWLDVDIAVLWARLRGSGNRPLLDTPDPEATLTALLEARTPVYASADIVVPVASDESIAATVRRVRSAVEAHAPGFFGVAS